ncbi:peptide chain release factor N(5)-glutamine methyltransferase [Streptococcus dentiloxodontae]
MTYAQLLAELGAELEAVGEEAQALTYVLKELKNWTATDFVLLQRQQVSSEDEQLIASIFEQLKNHFPAQYITGYAYFSDLKLKVDERVLIPRPETEELVTLILAENSRANRSVLDIGTGSGAIALALKQARSNWQVTATDVSAAALSLAKENASACGLEVSLVQSDVFNQLQGQFDIIVSNPPYIAFDDKNEVGKNVLKYEPHLALFAEENGFAVYRRIAEEAQQYLTQRGKLYFEIGYKQGKGLTRLLAQHFPKKRIRVLKDMLGKDRMVVMDNG